MKKLVLRAFALPAALAVSVSLAAVSAGIASASETPITSIIQVAPVLPPTPQPSSDLKLPDNGLLPASGTATGGAGDAPSSVSPTASYYDGYAQQVYNLINVQRRAAGVSTLRWNQNVADVSQEWADHLGVATQDPNFDWSTIHRADGGGTRISTGATWYAEIIAFNFAAQDIVDWWMNSPSHRAAMLDGRETDVGVGFVVPTSGPYKGWHLVVSNLAAYPGSTAPLVPAPLAAAPAPTPTPAPAPAPVSPFRDLSAGQQFLKEMNWMATKSISTGWTEADGSRTYRPLLTVGRDAMAAFMYRLAGSPAYTPPATSPFTDVPTTRMYYKEIAWLNATKISTGWVDANNQRTFRPLQSVDRGTMAAFLYRLSGSPAYTPPTTTPFTDVAKGQQFYKEISWLAARGICTGWTEVNGSATFRPGLSVNRDAMAAFMYRWAS